MIIPGFSLSRLPRILFGPGCFSEIPSVATRFGRQALVVTGARSLEQSGRWQRLADGLREKEIEYHRVAVPDEPTPELIDHTVAQFLGTGITVVIGVGGGSVLDAAKAIAGLLPHGNSVMDHLEGVGRDIPYHGPSIPYVAVPTTAGTGSEATKNAVLSVRGEAGFKKSFRHECLVAEYAIVDPDLLESCPPDLVAADGMDAFTQLLESFVSMRANPITDALALSGMEAFRDGFFPAWRGGGTAEAAEGRKALAYASLMSGITLAQAGLGAVHGLAAPLGAFFPIPHGLACGTLLAESVAANVEALRRRLPLSPALAKYQVVSDLLTGNRSTDQDAALEALVRLLREWTETLGLKPLSHFGLGHEAVSMVVANSRGTSMQTNPIVLTDSEVASIVSARL